MAHSKNAIVKLDNSSGVLTNISTYCNSCEMPQETELLKNTTFGGTAPFHTYESGFSDGTMKIGGPWSRAVDNFMEAILAAQRAGTLASESFEYAPEGTDAGDVKKTCEVLLQKYSGPKASIEDLLEWEAEFQVSGAITVATY